MISTDTGGQLYLDLLEKSLTGTLFDDPSFQGAYQEDLRREGRDWPTTAASMIGHLRMRNLRTVVQQVLADEVPGDFIETGIWRGGACIYMRAILQVHGITDRFVYCADSFEGLPPPDPDTYPEDIGDEHYTFEDLRVTRADVEDLFRRYGLLDDQVRFLEGWFADTLPTAPIEQLAVLRLDGDMYSSTMDALNALYRKLSVGGFVIVDDYGAVRGCAAAIEDFRKEHGISDPLIEIDWTGRYWQRTDGAKSEPITIPTPVPAGLTTADAIVTLDDLEPNADLRDEEGGMWTSIGNDPWFVCGGEFDAGNYVLALDAVVEGTPPRQPLIIYHAGEDGQFNEENSVVFRGLQRDHEHNPRSLNLVLPVGTRSIRFDPIASPGRFQLTEFAISRRSDGSPPYLEQPVANTGEATNWSYFEDGLATIHNSDFMSSPRFLEAYAAGEATGSWHGSSLHWRTYICLWAAERGLGLKGDFVECGVNRGGYAAAIAKYVDFTSLDRKFYLLDTFAGIPTELVSEAEKRHGILEYDYGDSFDAVQRTFSPYPNVELVRGRIPDTLRRVPSDQIAFLSIDLNNAAPEIAAAEAFWPRLTPGAVVVLDDYGWERHIEQKHAFDKFAADHGVSVLPFPTGQGLLIKP